MNQARYRERMSQSATGHTAGANAAESIGARGVGVFRRRALSIGLYIAAFAVLVVFFPVLVFAAIGIQVVRPRKFAALRLLLFTVFFLGMELIGVVAAAYLWVTHHSAGKRSGARYLQQNFRLQCWWGGTLARAGLRIFGMQLRVEEPVPNGGRPFILFIRHTSFADTVIACLVLSAQRGIQLRYVLKRALLWDPCLDIVGHRIPNVFVRKTDVTGNEVAAIAKLMRGLGPDEGVLIYPEGTRFTEAKRAFAIERLKQNGDIRGADYAASLRHVLPPKLGGSMALLRENGGADAVFCAHTGLEGVATMRDILNGATVGKTVRVRFTTVPFEAIPSGVRKRRDWLHEEWTKVDAWVDRCLHSE
jgi:1-acyl-sn-glycerol-3-phosphate acyltransferase